MASVIEKEYMWGVGTFKFTPTGGTEVNLTETYEGQDTKLVFESESTGVNIDQKSAPQGERISKFTGIITCALPYDREALAVISPGFEKGATGYVQKSPIGLKLVEGALEFIPKGVAADSKEVKKYPLVKVKTGLEANFKKDGIVFVPTQFTIMENAEGDMMSEGDYTKKTT